MRGFESLQNRDRTQTRQAEMKTLKFFIGRSALGCIIALSLTSKLQAQTNLQFTGVNVTDEGNIHLAWSSVSNEIYQIQEADALINTNGGAPTWNLLYDEYPSQGTNTFWLDTGNYNLVPQILNPKDMPMRFYRIVDEGQDSLASDEPIVTIISPTNDVAASGELTVAVIAATDQPVLSWTKLYVDGQEMQPAATTTNYTEGSTNYQMTTFNINTCEWGDETHVLFATAQSDSGYGDAMNSAPVMSGHGVSPFVPVLFSNLITRISFSQPSFNPASGQTQQVSAVFAANSDWTLNITDINSNTVRTAAGSGSSMTYSWDGTGTGETNLPAGIYFYYISAETNGESYDLESGGSDGGGSSGGSPPSPDFAMSSDSSDSTELWAMSEDGSDAVPLALYPPGFDTNDLTIFSATAAEVDAARAPVSRFSMTEMGSGGSISPADSGGGSSAAGQSAPATPQRPPNNPISGTAGTFGIARYMYTENGTNGISIFPLPDGSEVPDEYIKFGPANNTASTSPPLPQFNAEAGNFVNEMQSLGWQCGLNESDPQMSIYQLEGSGNPLNNVELGVLLSHGDYGTSTDYAARDCKQMYYPIGNQWLRLSQMTLGGSSSTNGLKWFALLSCFSLYQANWNSMQSHEVYPYNSNLHLLLGTDSENYTSPTILQYWAQDMIVGTNNPFAGGGFAPLTIKTAWFQAAENAYQGGSYGNTIVFAVAGDSACQNDTLQSYSSPGGTWTYSSQQVWPQQ